MSDDPDLSAKQRHAGGELVGNVVETTGRFVSFLVGGFLILIGIPLAIVTPFPFVPIGAVVILAGMTIIARNSRTVRAFVYRVRRRNPKLSARIPKWVNRLLLVRPD